MLTQHRAPSSSTPISYRANVNRQKTKKWTEAKAADYGGDDWGDDEEDEYGPPETADDEIKAPVSTEPKGYGDLTTKTMEPGTMARSMSFDGSAEKRDFSAAALRQVSQPAPRPAPIPGMPATRFSQMGVPASRALNPLQTLPTEGQSTTAEDPEMRSTPLAESPAPMSAIAETAHKALPSQTTRTYATDSRSASIQSYQAPSRTDSAYSQPTRANTNTSSQYADSAADTVASAPYYKRRDYSPSAAVQPLTTRRESSATDNAAENRSERKASFGQAGAPPTTDSNAAPTPKPLPFVRPADIYKRAEEQRERERRSTESSRPSLDSAVAHDPVDMSTSPGRRDMNDYNSSKQPSIVPSSRPRGPSFGREEIADPVWIGSAPLETVTERQSEYGFDNFDKSKIETGFRDPRSTGDHANTSHGTQQPRKESTSPKIPDLPRMSGFGHDLFSTGAVSPDPVTMPKLKAAPLDTLAHDTDHSSGLHAAIKSAFTRDGSTPNTPISRDSTDVRRNDAQDAVITSMTPTMFGSSGPVESQSTAKAVPTQKSYEDLNVHPLFRNNSKPPNGANAAMAESTTEVNTISSRPVPNKEESFRPSLPGGWVSYAPSATTSSAQDDQPNNMSSLAKADSAIPDTSNLTSQPSTALLPAELDATVSHGEEERLAVGDSDRQTDFASDIASQQSPTPAHSQTKALATLHADARDEAPVPLPKDTPPLDRGGFEPSPGLTPGPSVSKFKDDTANQDRLSQEIVAQLSPRPTTSGWADGKTTKFDQEQETRGQEGTYLPSEYDNYWTDTADTNLSLQAPSKSMETDSFMKGSAVSRQNDTSKGASSGDGTFFELGHSEYTPQQEEVTAGSNLTAQVGAAQEPLAGNLPGSSMSIRNVSDPQLQPQPVPKDDPPAQQSRTIVLSFKDIMALPSPEQRIRAFNDTRRQFAEQPKDLHDWVQNAKSQLPEHSNVTSVFAPGVAVPVGGGSARHKLVQAVTSGASSQQAYFQQYLNANASQTSNTKNSSSTPSGAQQGTSQGTKLSTHQVQAKGKELLHTAGVFGGKAGKAGKGLLARGKSKFKGTGGEKVD